MLQEMIDRLEEDKVKNEEYFGCFLITLMITLFSMVCCCGAL